MTIDLSNLGTQKVIPEAEYYNGGLERGQQLSGVQTFRYPASSVASTPVPKLPIRVRRPANTPVFKPTHGSESIPMSDFTVLWP